MDFWLYLTKVFSEQICGLLLCLMDVSGESLETIKHLLIGFVF